MKNKTKEELKKKLKEMKDARFKNCIVCLKKFPLKQSDTKRYCSKECSDIAMRVRDWEFKRGSGINEIKAQLKGMQQAKKQERERILKIIENMFTPMPESIKELKEKIKHSK